MYKTKLLASILLIATVLFAQVGVAAAAAPAQDASFDATIQTIVPEKDANGTITVVVTYTDAQGATQTVRLTEDAAVTLGLLTIDPNTSLPAVDPNTGLPLVESSKVGATVTIQPTDVAPDQPTEEEPVHPIAAMLASFFDVDGSVVNEYHQDGYGFGVIAQALWMAQTLNGDATTAGLILEAKKSGDYSAFTLPDGSSPTNWGQFKKAVSDNKKNNLGMIVSGKATNDTTNTTTSTTGNEHGNGKDKNKDKGNGKDNGHGKP